MTKSKMRGFIAVVDLTSRTEVIGILEVLAPKFQQQLQDHIALVRARNPNPTDWLAKTFLKYATQDRSDAETRDALIDIGNMLLEHSGAFAFLIVFEKAGMLCAAPADSVSTRAELKAWLDKPNGSDFEHLLAATLKRNLLPGLGGLSVIVEVE